MFRSSDGRGALFWAYEFAHTEAIELLEKMGVDAHARDANGKTPVQIGLDNAEINAEREFPYATSFEESTPVRSSHDGYNDDHFDLDEDDDDTDL